jgi:putative FmdB family regulatory protein
MPLYEYRCEVCSHQFTLLQTVHVRPGETICPKCGARDNRRLFSAFAMKGNQADGLSSPTGGGCGTGGCGCH